MSLCGVLFQSANAKHAASFRRIASLVQAPDLAPEGMWLEGLATWGSVISDDCRRQA